VIRLVEARRNSVVVATTGDTGSATKIQPGSGLFPAERYLVRNPDLAVNKTRQVLANTPNSTRVFPVSRPQQAIQLARRCQ